MKKVLSVFILFIACFSANGALAAGTVEINTASLTQLDQITGIGPALAQRIVDARPFSSLNDLIKVKGIGEKTLQKIKDQGVAYVENSKSETLNPKQTPNTNETKLESAPPAPAATIYPDGVIINEILPAPEGADEINEWVEIYNTNAVLVDVSGWKLQDIGGTGTTYIFPQNTSIAAKGYIVLTRPDTKIILNNDEDGLELLQPDGKMVNSVSFTKAPANQSYNKTNNGWKWSATATPNKANTITLPVASAKKKSTSLPKTKKTDNKTSVTTASLVDAASSLPDSFSKNLDPGETSNPWLLFFVALAIAIFSAIVILLLKLRLFKVKP